MSYSTNIIRLRIKAIGLRLKSLSKKMEILQFLEMVLERQGMTAHEAGKAGGTGAGE